MRMCGVEAVSRPSEACPSPSRSYRIRRRLARRLRGAPSSYLRRRTAGLLWVVTVVMLQFVLWPAHANPTAPSSAGHVHASTRITGTSVEVNPSLAGAWRFSQHQVVLRVGGNNPPGATSRLNASYRLGVSFASANKLCLVHKYDVGSIASEHPGSWSLKLTAYRGDVRRVVGVTPRFEYTAAMDVGDETHFEVTTTQEAKIPQGFAKGHLRLFVRERFDQSARHRVPERYAVSIGACNSNG